MTPEERERLAERWLEAALTQQARNAEPRAGLESRILATLATGTQRLSWWQRLLAGRGLRAGLAVAAALLLLAVGSSMWHARWRRFDTARRPQTPPPSASVTADVASAQPPALVEAPIAHPQGKRLASPLRRHLALAQRHDHEASAAPRMAQFPAATPLSAEERLLLRYVQRTPPEEVMAVLRDNEELQQRIQQEIQSRPPMP